MTTESSSRIRLGPFEVDTKTGEIVPIDGPQLRKSIFLQEKSLRLLRMLVAKEGELVLREDIQKTLWPNDTVVDFDHGIHVAVATLRRAFGDAAAKPQFIETVPRRGYRLLVPIERAEAIEDSKPPIESQNGKDISYPDGPGLIGKMVSHFLVLATIGSGGMGTVYEAEDTKLGRRVALKVLPEEMADDPAALKRFEREARTASSLSHRNICTIYSVEEFERQPIIVMELLKGETLRDRLARAAAEPVSLDELVDIALQTCDGLAAAHSGGIIHRDIKPANLFLITADQTATRCIKILDFGLAKLIAADSSNESLAENTISDGPGSGKQSAFESDISKFRPGGAAGTASYMSPEQIRRETLDARTDLFSFGLVLYEMATGQRAYPDDAPVSVREALLDKEPIPARHLKPSIPPSLEAVIGKALQKNRDARYQSAQELRAALEAVRQSPRSWHKGASRFLSAAAVLATVALLFLYWHSRARFRLAANDAIIIADATNQTSDPVLGDAINTALQVEFAQSPFFQVLAQDKIRQSMESLKFPVDASITPDVAIKICLNTNSKAVITSNIADEGNNFHIQLAAIDCQSGKIFAKVHSDAATRDQIVHQLGNAAVSLRRLAGEPSSSITQYNMPLEMATSSSPDALHLFSQGVKQFYSTDIAGTTTLLQRTTQIDPSFALAYAVIGPYYLQFGKINEAKAAEASAHSLRDRLTGQNRYMSDTLYSIVNFGDLDAAYPVFEQWVKTFPYDGVGHANFGQCLMTIGQYDRSAIESREAIRLLPKLSHAAYYDLMVAMVNLNRMSEAKAVYQEAVDRTMDDPILHDERHLVAFLENDDAEMHKQLERLKATTYVNGIAERREAEVHAYYGQFESARRFLQIDEVYKGQTDLPYLKLDLALQEVEGGDILAARKILNDVPVAAFPSLDYESFVLARAGEEDRAQEIADRLNQQLPRDTMIQHYSLPSIRAAISLERNDPVAALKALAPTQGYELAYASIFNDVYPAYLRGLALLRSGQGHAAAIEFQKLIDHPGLVGRQALGAIVWVQLARAQKQAGDISSARKSYTHFLEMWKHADADVPIYRQAKLEFSALRNTQN